MEPTKTLFGCYKRVWLFQIIFLLFIFLMQNGQNVIATGYGLVAPYYGATETCTQNYHSGHKAYDLGMSFETVIAVAGGVVSTARWYNNNDVDCHRIYSNPDTANNAGRCGYGLHARVTHLDNSTAIYGHLSSIIGYHQDSVITVEQGEILGTSGNSGYSSAPHLHLELRNSSGVQFDPYNQIWASGSCVGTVTAKNPVRQALPVQVIQLDDGDTGVTITCDAFTYCPHWYTAYIGFQGDAHWTYRVRYYDDPPSNNDFYYVADYKASWFPVDLQLPGIYEVQIHIPSANATTWESPYQVTVSPNVTNVAVDQLSLSNQWVSLGQYSMTKYLSNVTMYDSTPDVDNARVAFDAIRFIRLDYGVDYLPIIFK